jgi:hypothetical protein
MLYSPKIASFSKGVSAHMHCSFFGIDMRSAKNSHEQPNFEGQKVTFQACSGPDQHLHYILLCGFYEDITFDLICRSANRH